MSQIKKQYYQVKRRFDDSEFVYKLYLLWFVATVLGVGIFCIKPMIELIYKKIQLINEINTDADNIKINIATIDKISSTILVDTEAVSSLNTSLPENLDVEQYVVDLSKAVASAGFILKRVGVANSMNTSSGAVRLACALSGPGNFPVLIENIEKLKRITRVDTYVYRVDTHSLVDGDADITMGLLIYSLKGAE
jgi:hypothetical protein